MKKIISILLSTVIVLFMSVSACAETEADLAAKELRKYNIMSGNFDGNFHLGDTVTRAEMAKMVVIMMGLSGNFDHSNFTDVSADHWACGYITQAASIGIINGMGDGTFRPDDFVTYEQASKMLVCALGYNVFAERRGGYPVGYVKTAGTLGIATEKVDVSAYAKRSDIVVMFAVALDVPIMVAVENADSVSYKVLNGEGGESMVTFRTNLEK